MNPTTRNHPILKLRNSISHTATEPVIAEKAVTLTVNGAEWLTFLCTPQRQDELAAGFLFTGRFVNSNAEISVLEVCGEGNRVDVWLSHPVQKPSTWQLNSGCSGGVSRGQPDIDMVTRDPSFSLSLAQIDNILAQFYSTQEIYRTSGGVHSSALFSGEKLITFAEDIGRHNTLDKIAGYLLLQGLTPPDRVLVTTGRVSLEMMLKAITLNVPFVISRTSPTSASIDLAIRAGITLIGYARKGEMNIYTFPDSITIPAGTSG